MKAWTRANRATQCGNCPTLIAIGQPVQVLKIDALKGREFYRCPNCADSDVPPDLPATIEPGRRTTRMEPIRKLATRVDWKAKASQA